MGRFEHLRVRQVDSSLSPFREIQLAMAPEAGWIRAVRETLGMSLRQLAQRMGVAKGTAAALERSEAGGTVQLNSLKAAATALNCELVYALVPRESLESLVRGRARAVAERRVGRVSESMELEEQGIPESERERQVLEIAERLWEEMPRDLWNEID